MSNNLAQNEKHFTKITLDVLSSNETASTLTDNSFADITFDQFYGLGINRITNKAFGKTAKTIQEFTCPNCDIVHSQSYNIWATLNQFTELKSLTIRLNISEIPSNALNKTFKLQDLTIFNKQNLTLRSNAFEHLNNLYQITLYLKSVRKIEKSAFKFSNKTDERLKIYFLFSNEIINGDVFEAGSFDGAQRPLSIWFDRTNITHIPESSFKSVLSNNKSEIQMFYSSHINCYDCRNKWLIKEQKDNQVFNAYCTDDIMKNLFDPDVKSYLNSKCK